MDNIFSGNEIVELGIQIEKNGRDFYDTLSKRSKNPAAIEMFKFLSGEEDRHILVFKNILENFRLNEPLVAYADEYFAYMNALASDYVFTQKDKGAALAKKITSDNEAVAIGIGFEKDSIIFYEGVKNIVPENDKQAVDSLIREEKKHFKQLSDLKKKIS